MGYITRNLLPNNHGNNYKYTNYLEFAGISSRTNNISNSVTYQNGMPVKYAQNENSIEVTYDGFGRIRKVNENNGSTTTNTKQIVYTDFTNNAGGVSGAMSSVTMYYGNSFNCAMYYNKYGQPLQVNENGVLKEKYTYNSNKKLIECVDNYAGLRYTYEYETKFTPYRGDPLRVRVYKDSAEILNITTDEYYADNNRVGRTEYEYSGYKDTYTSAQDKFNRVVKETSPLGEVTFEYDDLGRVTSRTAYGRKETYGYMARVGDSAYTTPLANSITYSDGTGLKYTYNSNGNIVRIDDQSGKTLVSYEYDYLNRLIRENDSRRLVTYQYYYYNSGNLSYKEEYPYTTAETCASHMRRRYIYINSGNRMTSYDGKACTYDANGNPTTYLGNKLVWTRGRLLQQYVDNTFVYNADGIRVKKNNTEYILDGGRIIAEKENGSITKRYFYDGTGIAGMEYAGAKYYFRKNLQGDVIGVLNASGTVIGTYEYGAWGSVTTRIGVGSSSDVMYANPFRYRGYYRDSETGLYYLNSRYYDPAVGRFLNADAYSYIDSEDINGLNLYAYCNNNPVMYSDTSGHSWESFWNGVGDWFQDNWLKLVIGSACILGGALITALTAGAGVGFFATFGSALLSSTIQTGISMGISAALGGTISAISGNGFWNGFTDGLADGFMWGGIFAGGAQLIGGGFRLFAKAGVQTGRHGGIMLGKSGVKILSPDNNSWTKAGGTLIKFGKAFRIDAGAHWGLHMHILSLPHLPIGVVLAGLIGIL